MNKATLDETLWDCDCALSVMDEIMVHSIRMGDIDDTALKYLKARSELRRLLVWFADNMPRSEDEDQSIDDDVEES